jgi:predicted secreted protein
MTLRMQLRNEKFFTLFGNPWLERRQGRRNRVAVAISMSVAAGCWRRSAGMGIESVSLCCGGAITRATSYADMLALIRWTGA